MPASILDALVADLVAKESAPFLAALRYSETGMRKRADWETTWEKQRAEDAIDEDLEAGRAQKLAQISDMMSRRADGESEADHAARVRAALDDSFILEMASKEIAAQAVERKMQAVGDIPVPPKYRTPDFLAMDIWRLRGALDVPKERFVSFPPLRPRRRRQPAGAVGRL